MSAENKAPTDGKIIKHAAYSWEDIDRDARILSSALKDVVKERGEFSRMVVVARGGLAPASIISYELDIRLVETFCVASYHGLTQGEIEVLKPASNPQQGKGTLVLDDLVDTGRTFQAIREHLPEAYYATLYSKPQGLPTVNLYVHQVPQTTWIDFPWG